MAKKVKVFYYQCDICKKNYESESVARECERSHRVKALQELTASLINLRVAASAVVNVFTENERLDNWVNTEDIIPQPRKSWVQRIDSLIKITQQSITKSPEKVADKTK